jgi:hypothetical protein
MSQLSKGMRDEARALRNEGSPDTATLLEQAADELERLDGRVAQLEREAK